MSKYQSINPLQHPHESIQLVSTKELAKLVNRKAQTIRSWLHKDQLPPGLVRPRKIKDRNYWLWEDVQNFINYHFSPEDNKQ